MDVYSSKYGNTRRCGCTLGLVMVAGICVETTVNHTVESTVSPRRIWWYDVWGLVRFFNFWKTLECFRDKSIFLDLPSSWCLSTFRNAVHCGDSDVPKKLDVKQVAFTNKKQTLNTHCFERHLCRCGLSVVLAHARRPQYLWCTNPREQLLQTRNSRRNKGNTLARHNTYKSSRIFPVRRLLPFSKFTLLYSAI